MVKLTSYSLITVLPIVTSTDPHIRNLLFTHSQLRICKLIEKVIICQCIGTISYEAV